MSGKYQKEKCWALNEILHANNRQKLQSITSHVY